MEGWQFHQKKTSTAGAKGVSEGKERVILRKKSMVTKKATNARKIWGGGKETKSGKAIEKRGRKPSRGERRRKSIIPLKKGGREGRLEGIRTLLTWGWGNDWEDQNKKERGIQQIPTQCTQGPREKWRKGGPRMWGGKRRKIFFQGTEGKKENQR